MRKQTLSRWLARWTCLGATILAAALWLGSVFYAAEYRLTDDPQRIVTVAAGRIDYFSKTGGRAPVNAERWKFRGNVEPLGYWFPSVSSADGLTSLVLPIWLLVAAFGVPTWLLWRRGGKKRNAPVAPEDATSAEGSTEEQAVTSAEKPTADPSDERSEQ